MRRRRESREKGQARPPQDEQQDQQQADSGRYPDSAAQFSGESWFARRVTYPAGQEYPGQYADHDRPQGQYRGQGHDPLHGQFSGPGGDPRQGEASGPPWYAESQHQGPEQYRSSEQYQSQEQYRGQQQYRGQEQYRGPDQYAGESPYYGVGEHVREGQPSEPGRYPGPGQQPGAGYHPRGSQYSGPGQYPGPGGYSDAGPYRGDGEYPGGGEYPGAGQYGDPGQYPGGGEYAGAGQYPGGGEYPGPGQYPGAGEYPGRGQYPGAGQYSRGYYGQDVNSYQSPHAGQDSYRHPAAHPSDAGQQFQPGQPETSASPYRAQSGAAGQPQYPSQPGTTPQQPHSAHPMTGAEAWYPSQPVASTRSAGSSHTVMPASAPGPSWPPSQRQSAEPASEQDRAARHKGGRKNIRIVLMVAVLLAGVVAAGGSYLLLRTKGSPQQTATTYLNGWHARNYRAMDRVSLGVPHGGLAGPLTKVATELGVRSTALSLGKVTASGGTAVARFTVTDKLASGHVWKYSDSLRLVTKNRRWWVKWSPAAIYPRLKAGERFVLASAWPARAQILDASGTVLSSPSVLAQSGSIGLMTGIVANATSAQAKKLGAPYKAGDPIGLGGIEQAYQSRLAGRPSLTISLVGPGRHADGVAARFPAAPGRAVRTSISLPIQLAASAAVSGASTKLPVDMVVIQPSTGRVLAMVERPGGFDRALAGIFPPGSTFKVVTASALAKTGMTPASTVQCPSQVNIGGLTIHNDQNEHFGTTTLLNAFAVSCNTTFAELATQKLTGATLRSMALTFGFNGAARLGIPATLGKFTLPHTSVDLATDAFGQGKDLVNPLSQATVAAAIDAGVWRPPLLVVNPKPKQAEQPHVISPTILNALRPMMRAVVTSGTAAGVGFPPGVYGKTGTAEYGTGLHPKAHGWFIGYDGDIAFAVLVEGGGYGATSAGPIANSFLHKIGA